MFFIIEIIFGADGNRAVRHEIIRYPNGDIGVKFFDKNNKWVDAVQKIKNSDKFCKRKIDKEALEKLSKTDVFAIQHNTPDLAEITEPHFLGFRKPVGPTSCCRLPQKDGSSIVRFRNSDGEILREIKCDKSGYPIEYTNYERCYENLHGQITKAPDGTYLPVIGKCNFDEVIKKNTYRINDSEVLSTTQIREVTTHNGNRVSPTFKTKVERRGSKFEEVTIESGDKRINEFFVTLGADRKSRLVFDNSKNLTKEEIRLIQSDPYLSSRYYNDGVEFVNSSSPITYGNEGIRNPERTLITFEAPHRTECGYYMANPRSWTQSEKLGGRINMTPSYVEKGARGDVLNTQAHETRHAHQYDIMEDNQQGKLHGSDKIFADKLEYARDNYVSAKKDYEAYRNNFMEVDARARGEEVQDLFNTHGENQRRIFVG